MKHPCMLLLIERENRDEPDCCRLAQVYHVTHIDVGWRILTEGKIKAGLVCDESKLKTERILVTWVSPNDWTGAGGFRYGNVRFSFDWEPLIRDMNYYWVESVAYRTPASRVLITGKDYGGILDEYDPTAGDGPDTGR